MPYQEEKRADHGQVLDISRGTSETVLFSFIFMVEPDGGTAAPAYGVSDDAKGLPGVQWG